ncbi:Lar family restriction alleviation protein [Xenorhabdus szentirmaii]|uniref:Lar family restriction alleviation protein n=1 Tax=Xenorhabdus szentirmaii TaxID=290112 RepID=UPI00387E52CE
MMAEIDEIKPCPFCNSGRTEMNVHSDGPWFFVQCIDCNANGPEDCDHDSAIQSWNRRVENTSPQSK